MAVGTKKYAKKIRNEERKKNIDREPDGLFFNAQCTMTVISRRKVDCNQKRNEKPNKNKNKIQWDKNPKQTRRDRDETDRQTQTD